MELEKIELENINIRKSLCLSKSIELQILQREFQIYQKELLEKKGLDITKNYKIDDQGNIEEVESADNKGE